MIHFEKLEPNDFNTFKSWVSNREELFQFSGPIFNFPLTDEQLMNYTNDSSYRSKNSSLMERILHSKTF